MKLARKTDESASDVVGYGMATRRHQHCGGAADSVHRQSSGHPGCVWKMVFYHARPVCVPEACDVLVTSKLSWIHLSIGNRDSE